MDIIFPILTGFFAFIVIITLISYTVRIIPQSNSYVVERLGAYYKTLERGLHFIIPIIDRVAGNVTLKEQVFDFAPQPVITKDNVTMMIDTVVYFQILDPKLYVYGVVRPIQAIENLSATTLRNIIGDLELDETLTSREIINTKMRVILDEATDPWGIKVSRVEVKNILPPKDIQEAMEKQLAIDPAVLLNRLFDAGQPAEKVRSVLARLLPKIIFRGKTDRMTSVFELSYSAGAAAALVSDTVTLDDQQLIRKIQLTSGAKRPTEWKVAWL